MSAFVRGGYWYVEVSLPTGKKLKRSVGRKGIVTKAVAKELEQDLKRKIKLGQLDMSQPTFNDFIPEFVSYLRDVKQNRAWRQGGGGLHKRICFIIRKQEAIRDQIG